MPYGAWGHVPIHKPYGGKERRTVVDAQLWVCIHACRSFQNVWYKITSSACSVIFSCNRGSSSMFQAWTSVPWSSSSVVWMICAGSTRPSRTGFFLAFESSIANAVNRIQDAGGRQAWRFKCALTASATCQQAEYVSVKVCSQFCVWCLVHMDVQKSADDSNGDHVIPLYRSQPVWCSVRAWRTSNMKNVKICLQLSWLAVHVSRGHVPD